MKIDPRLLFQNAQADLVKKTDTQLDPSQARPKSRGVSSPGGEDSFTLSSTLVEAQRLQAGVANVPEIRAERVQTLQAQVQKGEYQADSQKIADALVAEHTSLNVKA